MSVCVNKGQQAAMPKYEDDWHIRLSEPDQIASPTLFDTNRHE
jgi:hypothetical protein